MEQQVIVDPFQQVSHVDFNRFGQFPTDSLDHVVGDIGITGLAYTGFPVTSPTQNSVDVDKGRFYKNGEVYFLGGKTNLDLTNYLPAATYRWLAVTVAGYPDDTNPESRTFLTDVKTRAAIARTKPTIRTRIANPGIFGGPIGPDPLKPVPGADVVVVAYVKVSTTGVVEIQTNTTSKVTSISALAVRLDENDEWRASAGNQINTLRSDITNLSGRINGLAPIGNVVNNSYEIARLKEKVGLPQTYAAAGADHFLVADQTDTANVDNIALVEEGVRFAPIQIQDDQLGLQNVLDPNVVAAGNFLLPAYDLVDGLSSLGTDMELSIANFAHTTVQTVQKTVARSRIRFGAAFYACSNQAWWQSGRYDPVAGVFKLATGETFNVISVDASIRDHIFYRIQQFWIDNWLEDYWDAVTVPEGIDGFSVAQTFSNTQERFIGEIGLYFSRKAAQGNVRVLLCECFDDASPNPKKVIAKATVAPADIQAGNGLRTAVPITPTLIKVDRYAILVISDGNHYLWQTVNNKFADGTLFGTTDGGYYQGVADLSRDIAFDLKALKFRSPRVEVLLNPIGLPGGIVNIDITAQTLIPSGANIMFAYLQNAKWNLCDGTTPIVGLPAGLPFKVILTGTTSVMPGIGVLANSRVRTTRPRPDFKHISTARVMPANVTTVRVRCRLEWWRGATYHTFGVKLRTGAGYATITNPASFTEAPTQDDPANSIDREYFFSFAGPGIGSYKIEMSGTTTNVVTCFHVAERVDVGIL